MSLINIEPNLTPIGSGSAPYRPEVEEAEPEVKPQVEEYSPGPVEEPGPYRLEPVEHFHVGELATLYIGDCIEVLADFHEDSIDAIVTDPPYGLKFMGKKWDNVEYGFHREWAEQALRVLKPGGHLISFGGSRTYHWMAAAVEDAGFEIRDMIQWLYGQGFPKSMNVGKAIDKAQGVDHLKGFVNRRDGEDSADKRYVDEGVTNFAARPGIRGGGSMPVEVETLEAVDWTGWGTALKPAQEPIVLARKPLIGTVAENVLEHGTGALNIEASRVGTTKDIPASPRRAEQGAAYGDLSNDPGTGTGFDKNVGRFPSNVILDPEAARQLDEQTGALKSGKAAKGGHKRKESLGKTQAVYEGGVDGSMYRHEDAGELYGDSGGASRFFYNAKASKSEREGGLLGSIPCDKCGEIDTTYHTTDKGKQQKCVRNVHPTVKPVKLMEYLVRLVTPPDGVVLDPFLGSGTTGLAAVGLGFRFVGIEKDSDYLPLAEARIHNIIPEDAST